MAPTAETIEVMRKSDIDVSRFKSKHITDELIRKSDLILVMASHHMDAVIRRVPEAAQKTHLLKQYGIKTDTQSCEDLDIQDPIGQPIQVYERVLDTIEKEVRRIAPLL